MDEAIKKTCGNCGNVELEIQRVRCPYPQGISDPIKDWYGHPRYEHPSAMWACENWVEKQEGTLEQRYLQLEQVAQEMLELLEAIIDPSCEERCPIYALQPGHDNCVKEFRIQLEALGVSVDD